MNSCKSLLIDFEDSFTYNIVGELYRLGIEVDVISFQMWKKSGFKLENYQLLVLGPGPGHPDDYQILSPLKLLLDRPDIFVFGVCLGHQMISQALGFTIKSSKPPQHGQLQALTLNQWWQNFLKLPQRVEVLRYNSLAVTRTKLSGHQRFYQQIICGGEVQALSGLNFLSYQFHPESIGTNYRPAFFSPLKRIFL